MNKKNKGFTTIELITSFTLASVIMIILFNIILILKDNLSEVNAKTNMLVEKDNLSYNINKRFKEKELSSITMCDEGDKCYEFTYSDDTSDKLIYSNTDKTITFNNYTFDIIDGITVEEPTITEHYDTMSSTTYNGYFIIHIPIKLDDKDYSIKINKHFNTDSLVIDVGNYWDTNGNKYTQVEYLESTGTQYIDTGLLLPFTMDILFKYNSYSSANHHIIGNENASDPWNATYIRIDSGRYRSNCLGSGSVQFGSGDLEMHRYIFSCSSSVYTLIVDGEEKKNISHSKDYIDYTIYLFATNGGGVAKHFSQGRLYYSKFYSDIHADTLVRDYIPVIDSSERPCLFDKVEKKCYYNQGTGEFLYG